MTLEPLRSSMSMKYVEETSLALPSDKKLRSGHQRVLDQVHTIRQTRSKYSKSGSGSLSPTSPKTPNAFSEFRLFKYSPTTANGSVFSKGNSNGVTTFGKMVRTQHSFPPNAHSMKGTTSRRNMSTSSQKYFFPISPGVGGPTGSGQATAKNGLTPSRSNPELAPISATVQRGVSTLRSLPNRASVYSLGNGNSNGQFIGSNSGQFISSSSNPFLRSNSSHFVSSSSGQFVGSNPGQFVGSNPGQFVGSNSGQFVGSNSGQFVSSSSGQLKGNNSGQFVGSNSSQFVGSNSGQFVGSNSGQFLGSSSGQLVGSNPGQFLGSSSGQLVSGSSGQFVGSSSGQLGNGSTNFIGSQSRFMGAPSNFSNTESKMSLPKVKSKFIGVNLEGNSADITMKEAVEYLLSHDENYQHCGASFIQHSTYKEDKAKQEVLRLKGIPSLLALLRSPNAQVQQTVSAALRNLVFKNNSNKQEVQQCGGIAEAVNLLKDTDSAETQKQLTGLLWNLSSADNLKPELIKSALSVLTQSILLPFTGSGENANNNMDPEVFYNATGCLRNLSCGKKGNRQAIRNSRGLIDSLVSYVQDCVAADRPDDKSVENCVCVLHNLTYQLETEAPSHFSKITALAGTPTRSSARQTSSSNSIGCFSQQGSKIPQETTFDYPVIEDSNPKGVGWLFHSETMQTYLSLLSTSQTDATLEACVGALQNLTASKGIVSSVMSQAIVQKLNGLQLISPHLQSSNPNVQKTAMALVGNLSKTPRLQSSMSRQTLPQLASLLTSGAQNGPDSDDTMAMACQTMGSLLVAAPETGKKLLNNRLINSLNDLSKNSSLPKSSKAAALLLYGLWADKNFQGFFKKQGMNKGSFVNDITTSVHKSLQVLE